MKKLRQRRANLGAQTPERLAKALQDNKEFGWEQNGPVEHYIIGKDKHLYLVAVVKYTPWNQLEPTPNLPKLLLEKRQREEANDKA